VERGIENAEQKINTKNKRNPNTQTHEDVDTKSGKVSGRK
jgi:hypothetical protein